ncbi:MULTISPECIES: DUF3592 domain-containing protein [unclassified Rhizobium]|uniref:DUF3592 domain-containing protein n=1 Tax=unclassified Rhizobium TaxID=2613769 RepID=UPI000DE0A0FC|nr:MULTISPECIES: DUF3592 domain-containing protein [unclassified Rhizobium]MBB3286793.1 hypothetical protein [Rhizobium sp. BK252]MBB3401533.1 hypothetical protein [Rhizobium sp. BK289]MBB3414522.1 hypothetical protein [Rhizobium sp. BK284]MBB3482411.1 hypothetical protein [Rhizobium sp. BK347]MDK4718290.1 DUF3592 domain-containing protein [Rhizobium sp. CNPSo 3968]
MTIDDQHRVRVQKGGRIVLAIGLLLLVPGILSFVHSLGFVMQAQRTEATFEGAIERNTSYGVMYYPRFTFRTTDGREVSFTSGVGSSSQQYAPGSRLAILYDPAQPNHAQADSLFGVWLQCVVLLPPAFLVILIGTAILLRWHSYFLK